jgi:hypothetical protein
MTDYALLEIGLHGYDADWYRVEPRLWLPGEDAERRPPAAVPILARFDLDRLGREAGYDDAYGPLLTESLFGPPEVATLFAQARALQAADPPVPLRLRLHIGPTAPELHELRWETLRDPEHPDALLALDENVLLSRYLSSWDWRSVRLQSKGELRALIVVANPDDLAQDGLAAVDVPGELERAKEGLGEIPLVALCRCDDPRCDALDITIAGSPTLGELLDRLRDGYDVLYLVAHGKLADRVPWVWLETVDGLTERVRPDGPDGLVTQLAQLPQLPRLVVLASCQSAGAGGEWASGDGGALSALGPRLAEAGVPVVVAMQGNVTMETVKGFVPRFFEELAASGQIDGAAAVARRAVRASGRSDWWVPALFTRLHSGRLWYEPHFAGERLATWPDLLSALKTGKCTPILGPGLTEFLFGSPQEIARCWAEANHFPMAPHNFRSLPHVARYLATMQSPTYPLDQLTSYLRDEIRHRHRARLQGEPAGATLDRLIRVVGQALRQADEADPYRVLAQLPAEIYVSANADNLLFDALTEAGKDPQIALCPWNEYVVQPPDSAPSQDPGWRPSTEQPLIYYLFGRLDQPDSLVISEDDYFDYLIWVSQDRTRGKAQNPLPGIGAPSPPAVGGAQIPLAVSGAWSRNALLFLGFHVDDWPFRVLLHSVADPEAGIRSRRPTSVAVQVDPEASSFLQPVLASKYLEKYLAQFRNIHTNIYWGTAQDFVGELWARRQDWQ